MSLDTFLGVEPPEVEKKVEETKWVGEEETEWDEIRKLKEGCVAKRENYAYARITLSTRTTLDGVDKSLACETAVERPFKNEGDTYGGMWGTGGVSGTKEEIEKEIIELKIDLMDSPYLPRDNPDWCSWARDIKAENIFVFASKGAKDYLRELGIDFDGLVRKLEQIPENLAGEEFISLARRERWLEGEIEKLAKQERDYEDTIRAFFGLEGEYGKKPQVALYLTDKSADELQVEFGKIKFTLERDRKELGKVHSKLRELKNPPIG